MVCNFPRPTESTPSLLPHEDVETLFHEFGHMMHIICSRVDFDALSAFSVERDFIEMPSQVATNTVLLFKVITLAEYVCIVQRCSYTVQQYSKYEYSKLQYTDVCSTSRVSTVQ